MIPWPNFLPYLTYLALFFHTIIGLGLPQSRSIDQSMVKMKLKMVHVCLEYVRMKFVYGIHLQRNLMA